jgi:hypothetical protein
MPNVKVYMDDTLLAGQSQAAGTLLAVIRRHLCETLGVTEAACHIVALGVVSIPGQTQVNIELALLRKPDRSRDAVAKLCSQLRDLAAGLMQVPAAVRCALMEPEFYIVAR